MDREPVDRHKRADLVQSDLRVRVSAHERFGLADRVDVHRALVEALRGHVDAIAVAPFAQDIAPHSKELLRFHYLEELVQLQSATRRVAPSEQELSQILGVAPPGSFLAVLMRVLVDHLVVGRRKSRSVAINPHGIEVPISQTVQSAENKQTPKFGENQS